MKKEFSLAPHVLNLENHFFWFEVVNDALAPEIYRGSHVALRFINHNLNLIIFGKIYAVNSVRKGFFLRRLYPHKKGFICRSFNPKEYPDFVVSHEEINAIYEATVEARLL